MWKKIKADLNRVRLNVSSQARKIRQGMAIDKSEVRHLVTTVDCHKKWYGSSYGGFYIHPDPLHKGSIIYSFGIGKDITFDLKCIQQHGCHVYGFDPTPKSIDYIRSIKVNDHFHFFEFAVSPDITKHIEFFLPAHPKGVSGSLVNNTAVDQDRSIRVLAKSFTDIAKELGHTHVDVVKIDIEGSEYELLDFILQSGIRVDQLLVEFHDRYFTDGSARSKAVVEKLYNNGYGIFGHSMNFEEVSFIKRNLSSNVTSS